MSSKIPNVIPNCDLPHIKSYPRGQVKGVVDSQIIITEQPGSYKGGSLWVCGPRENTRRPFIRGIPMPPGHKKIILDVFWATTGYHRKCTSILLKDFKRFRNPAWKSCKTNPLGNTCRGWPLQTISSGTKKARMNRAPAYSTIVTVIWFVSFW